jgi:hypothetical protein
VALFRAVSRSSSDMVDITGSRDVDDGTTGTVEGLDPHAVDRGGSRVEVLDPGLAGSYVVASAGRL